MTRVLVTVVLAVVACGSPRSATPARHPAPAPVARLSWAQRDALKQKGIAAYDARDWMTCATLLEQAQDPYDAACCYAQAGKPDRAFALLEVAFDGSFRDVEHLKQDPDLVSLHPDPRWATTVDGLAARIASYEASLNPELLQIYKNDQADRNMRYEDIDWDQVTPRDQARRAQVEAILARGEAVVSDDYLHAAMVFQHGEDLADYQRAFDLAKKAVELDPNNRTARWLEAASEDRLLVFQGKPQKWATQFGKKDGVWILQPVDPGTTDEQLIERDLPTLAEARAQAAAMNAAPPATPSPAK